MKMLQKMIGYLHSNDKQIMLNDLKEVMEPFLKIFHMEHDFISKGLINYFLPNFLCQYQQYFSKFVCKFHILVCNNVIIWVKRLCD